MVCLLYTRSGRVRNTYAYGAGFKRFRGQWYRSLHRRRFMTVCVGAICENGKALVLAADKMIGMGFVEGEPDISKLRKLHKDWWVLFAGDDITPVFDIID